MAAKGVIESQGLSKVRHLGENVLWLQQQCARRILPITKVPGEDNIADLMTKHLGAAKIKKNVEMMGMKYEDGRAGKAAQLHLVQTMPEIESTENGLVLWDSMGDRLVDKRGGDFWKSRGEGGMWHRIHAKPRRSLFTPLKVAKGPNSSEKLNGTRFTKGVSQSGQKFEFHDCWTKPENAHRILDEPWIGCTTFIAEDVALFDVQCKRRGVQRPEGTTSLRWSDILA